MTGPLLVDALDADGVEQALQLARQFKDRFATVAKDVLRFADSNGLDERVAALAIASECLLLAAFMYHTDADREDFAAHAQAAIDYARKHRAAMGLQWAAMGLQ